MKESLVREMSRDTPARLDLLGPAINVHDAEDDYDGDHEKPKIVL
jgi:hypothetical protein